MFKFLHKARKKHMVLLLTLLVASICIMVFLIVSTHNKRPDHPPFDTEYKRAGDDTLNIAIEMNPEIYMVKGDEIYGRDYEMLMQISRTHHVPMKFYPFVPLNKVLKGLDEGVFDIVVASLPSTTDLKERYLLTDPVYLDREILVQLADNPVTSQLDLGGDTVWITAQSPFLSRLSNLSDEIGNTIYVKTSAEYSAETLFILTAKGVIKYAVINEGVARRMQKNYSNVDIETPISFTQFQTWALRKDNNQLCDSINSWLKDFNIEESRSEDI